jgi:hypothetical protein
MALRLRRGTNAERLTITPVESELIYTTDTKELWIGDGVTVGGNKIGGLIPQFLSDLTNVDADSPLIGQVLKWNGSNWVATDDDDTGVVEGSNYRINIIDDNSTIMVDSSTGTFTGTFVGDGSGLINLPISLDGSGIVEGSNYRINIVDDGSTILVNTSTGTFTGNGSGLTNLPSIFELNDVFSFTPPDDGDILIFDGINFVPQKIRRIEGDDSTVILDARTNTFTGNFVGDGSELTDVVSINGIFEGSDYRINIVDDSSTIMVNTSTSTLDGTLIGNVDNEIIITTDLTINNNDSRGINLNGVTLGNVGADLKYSVVRNSLISPAILEAGDTIIDIIAQGFDGVDTETPAAIIKLGVDRYTSSIGTDIMPGRILFLTFNESGTTSLDNALVFNRFGNLGIATDDPQEKLDVRGNGIFSGTLSAASFVGSLVSDDSTVMIDGINKSLVLSNIDIIGQTGNTPVDGVTVNSWLEVSVNGQIKYIPLYV